MFLILNLYNPKVSIKNMHLTIQSNLRGEMEISAKPSDTIHDVKMKLQKRTGTAAHHQVLFCGDMPMDKDRKLSEITDQEYFTLRLREE